MKIYCQFLHLSTGYVEGSIPPRFEESRVKPIEAVGSDGVMVLDARKNIWRLRMDCEKAMMQRGYIGYKIIRATSFLDKGTLITNFIIPKSIK